jgi:hypothetical protein
MRKIQLVAAVLGLSLAASGCVVHEREVVTERPAAPCAGAVWVENGNHSHWDCPRHTETVEVQVH